METVTRTLETVPVLHGSLPQLELLCAATATVCRQCPSTSCPRHGDENTCVHSVAGSGRGLRPCASWRSAGQHGPTGRKSLLVPGNSVLHHW